MRKETRHILQSLRRDIRELRDRRGYLNAGIPRFNHLFGRDSLIASWQLMDFDASMCRSTLRILSKLQGKRFNKVTEEAPGKIIHEAHLGPPRNRPHRFFPMPYYGSVDATPLYLIVFGYYIRRSRDVKFLNAHWRNICAANTWLLRYGDRDRDGFLEYARTDRRGIYHQGWKDGFRDHLGIKAPVAIVEAQGYAYLAFREVAHLASLLGDSRLSAELAETAALLKARFNESFWMPGEKFFCLALDHKKRMKRAIASNPGHLLFTGIVEGERVPAVVRRLFRDDLATPYGIRTLSMKDARFDPMSYHNGSVWPHDNWIIAQGLRQLGYRREYEKIKQGILLAYNALGKIPEHYAVVGRNIREITTACVPQAWASGALYNFLTS